jgi:hypothetical protein
LSHAKNTKKKINFVVQNPTELLDGLAKGVKVRAPVKQELTKASAMMVERKLARSKKIRNET